MSHEVISGRIMVPVDFSQRSMQALSYAVSWAKHFGSSVDVVHVWEPPAYVSADTMVSLCDEAGHRTIAELARVEIGREMKNFLDGFEQGGRRDERDAHDHGERIEVRGRLEIGPAAETIIRLAHGGEYHLVIMSTHGRRGLSRLVMGSIAEQVLRRALCPVLTLRLPESRLPEDRI